MALPPRLEGTANPHSRYWDSRAPSPLLGDLLLDTIDFSESDSECAEAPRLSSNSFVESKAIDSKRIGFIAKDMRCISCMDTKKNPGIKVILECGHSFHYICVKKELAKNSKCPTCTQPSDGPRIIAKIEKLEVKPCRTLCSCVLTSLAVGTIAATTFYFAYLRDA